MHQDPITISKSCRFERIYNNLSKSLISKLNIKASLFEISFNIGNPILNTSFLCNEDNLHVSTIIIWKMSFKMVKLYMNVNSKLLINETTIQDSTLKTTIILCIKVCKRYHQITKVARSREKCNMHVHLHIEDTDLIFSLSLHLLLYLIWVSSLENLSSGKAQSSRLSYRD